MDTFIISSRWTELYTIRPQLTNQISYYSDLVPHSKFKQKAEVSQKQISYDMAYMWNLKKNDINEFIYKTESHRCRKQNYGYQRRKQGSGGQMNWEVEIDIYTLLYIK